MKTIIISLKKDNELRRNSVSKEMEKMDINFEFYDAVVGNEIIKCESELIYENKSKFYNPNIRLNKQKMTDGELGCAWSHLNIYEMLVNDKHNDFYLIFEDDVKAVVDKIKFNEIIRNIPDYNSFDLCHLFYSEWYSFNKIYSVNDYYFVPERRFFNRAGAYIITKLGAIKLLKLYENFICLPADDLFSNTYINDPYFRVIVPNNMLFEPTFTKSTIEKIDLISQSKKYIHFEEFGYKGRLGNQMFQYACIRNLSIQNNMKINMRKQPSCFFNAFEINSIEDIQRTNEMVYNEMSMEYQKIPINTDYNLQISGFFQSEQYFSDIKDIIRKDFIFKKAIQDKGNLFINNFKDKLTVAIHVRRTDVINSDSPMVFLSVEYITRALDYILNIIGRDMYSVLIFSDDKVWCRDNLKIDNSIIVSGFSDIEELYIMTQCSHFITSPSSFSWWGSWLSQYPSKIIVMPDKWFSSKICYDKPLNTQEKDIYPESCIKLPLYL